MRPERPRIRDELGRLKSLASGPQSFESLPGKGPSLFLGLGPDLEAVAALAGPGGVSYLESPDMASRLTEAGREPIPDGWREADPEEISRHSGPVHIYLPALRLFPSYYGPLAASLRLSRLPLPEGRPREAWLPATQSDLLARELADALKGHGYTVRLLEPDGLRGDLPELLSHSRPALFLSVNFKGLDPYGENFWLLARAGCRVAVWLVDNPFHLLTGLRAPFFTKARLHVTDAWFMGPLGKLGCEQLYHTPLAAWPKAFADPPPLEDVVLAERLVFVGRSKFPGKKGFFAGARVPPKLLDQAKAIIAGGGRPDFAWWVERFGSPALWPGNAVRNVGLGAEESSAYLRGLCLAWAAATKRLTVYGDTGWAELLPGTAELKPPVDYYGPLASIYASARASLSVTSLLLPQGLTQRHFDVWTAGGFLISDQTPGLAIFPDELTREISFDRPGEIPKILHRLDRDPTLRRDLRRAWQKLILEEHTYARRVEAMIEGL